MLHRNALILVLGLWSMAATAQVPVVEAGGGRGQPAAAQSQNNDLLFTLYSQLEALQREVQTLRGLVEEQSNEIRRLQTEARNRYLDIDHRLSELSGAGAATGALTPALPGVTATTPGATAPAVGQNPAPVGGLNPSTTTSPQVFNESQGANTTIPPAVSLGNTPPLDAAAVTQAPAPAATPAVGAELGEQDLYRTALNLLLEQDKYDESIQMFQAYIDRFPQGRLLTNAYYWQGEALILVSRFEEARNVFTHLITTYPDDPKSPGAMLKLGVVYQQMGNRQLAESTWREIATRYPENATEIRTAQDYLNRR